MMSEGTSSNDLTTIFCSKCEAEKKESLRIQKYYNRRNEKQSARISRLEKELEHYKGNK